MLTPATTAKWVLRAARAALLIVAANRMCSAQSESDKLVIAQGGETEAVIVVSPAAESFEKRAAADLAKYIGLMCGDQPQIANTRKTIDAALVGDQPVLIVGREAFTSHPALRSALSMAGKKEPLLRSDAIVLQRQGNRVHLAGNNDRSHYFTAAELLRRWGCRWYMPTQFGECIPEQSDLTIDNLDYSWSSPFEIRTYWISWLGDKTGAQEFRLRNGRSRVPIAERALKSSDCGT